MRSFLIPRRGIYLRIALRSFRDGLLNPSSRVTMAWMLFGIATTVGCSDSTTEAPSQVAAKKSSVPQRSSLPIREASIEERLKIAENRLQRNQIDHASDLLQAILIEQPDHAYARFLFARCNHLLGKTEIAFTVLENSAEELAEHADRFIRELARLKLSGGDIMGALDAYDRLLAITPGDTQSRRLAATICNQLGLRFDANEHFRSLCKTVPLEVHELQCLLQPSSDVGRTKPTQWVGESPLSLVEPLRAIETNQIDESVELLEGAELVRRENPAAMCLMGRALSMQRDEKSFQVWYSKRTEAWRRYPDFWVAIGNAFASEGMHAQASRAYAAAVTREPMCRSALMCLGQSLAALGRSDDAQRILSRAKEIGDLTELVIDVAVSPRASENPYRILSSELTRMGLPYEGFAWQFLGIALFHPRGASMEQHAAGIASIRKARISVSLPGQAICRVAIEDPQVIDLEFWDGRIERTSSTNPSIGDTPSRSRPNPNAVFRNVADEANLKFRYLNADPVVQKYFLLHQSLGAGLACVDMDLDGRVDVYAAQGGFNAASDETQRDYVSSNRFLASNRLFRNLGDRFKEIGDQAHADDGGYAMGITAGDWNQDGFQDLVIGNLSLNTLLLNQGDGTFRKMPMGADWNDGLFTTGVALADIDGDALPDLVEVNYVNDARIFESIRFTPDGEPVRLPGPSQFTAAIDRVFFNVGEGSMRSSIISDNHGAPQPRAALGLIVGNLDGNDGNEIFVANDQSANRLWKVERRSVHEDVDFADFAPIHGLGLGVRGLPLASMGVAVADFDANGLPDLHVTSFNDELSNHFMQREGGSFDDRIVPSGLAAHSRQYVGFGTQAVDFENDTVPDLWVGNGHLEDFRETGQEFQMPLQLLVSNNNRFSLARLNEDEPFFARKHLSRALARLDWNGDGSVDILVGDLLESLALLQNQTANSNHWLTVQLVGTRCERDAIGSTIECQLGETTLHHFVCTGDGYMSRNENAVFMGLGAHSRIDRLQIRWPDGTEQSLSNLSADRRILVVQGAEDEFELTHSRRDEVSPGVNLRE